MASTVLLCLNIVALFCFCFAFAESASVQDSPLMQNYDASQTETFEVEFDKINKYLSTRRAFKSVENDMENVLEMFRANAKPDWWHNGAQQRALHLLATLSNISDSANLQCDEYANRIRNLCVASTRNLALLDDSHIEEARRLDRVVKLYLAKQAEACEKA